MFQGSAGVGRAARRVSRDLFAGRLGPSRKLSLTPLGILGVILLVTQVLGGSAAPAAVTSASSSLPPAPMNVSAIPYSAGRAFVSWEPGAGAESDSFHVETFRAVSAGFQDQGGKDVFGTNSVVTGLQPGSVYVFGVNARNAAGSGPASQSQTVQAVGSAVPAAPTSVTLTTDGADNQLALSWSPSSFPVAAERYAIGVFEGTGSSLHQVGAVNCNASCTSMVLQAQPGTITSADVFAVNGQGRSTPAWSQQVAVPQPCPLACLTVATGSAGGAVQHESNGFLDPNGSANPSGLIPTQWRTNSRTLNQTPASVLGQLKTASITEILSDDWLTTHNIGGYAFTPWSNWTLYSQWVTSEVKNIELAGAQRGFAVTYWEVQNEPFGGYYYSPSSQPPASETVANFEQQFLVAYQAIKAADPQAQVVGPSLIAWNGQPGDTPSVGIDMRTFLDFAAAHDIQLGAVSFHANQFAPLRGWYEPDNLPEQPAAIGLFVSELRTMLADRPSLGKPAILVNEYSDPYTYEYPGWAVGWLSALDSAGVTGAGRACWDGCGPTLDGLLDNDGGTPRPSFWAYAFYAGMTGQAIPVSTSYTDVTGLAALGGNGAISVLVGRHQSCTTVVNRACPSYAAAPVTVRIQVPGATTATVSTALIPMGSTVASPLRQLSPTETTVSVVDGWATVTTPNLRDGDAVEIAVTPAA